MSLWRLLTCISFSLAISIACSSRKPELQPPLVAQLSGTLPVSGLSSPVRVVRDHAGIPHIYATSRDDLFFAQGFVQAQDRLFQMDLWRRSGQGRLAEVLGPNFVPRDLMTRRMQYRGNLDAEWASYGPDARSIATAFVRGINAWVALARERPPELFRLAGWLPETWSANDLLNRADDFRTSHDAEDEVFRARLVAALGPARADVLLARTPRTVVAPGLDLTAVSPIVIDGLRRVGAPPFFLGLAAPVTGATGEHARKMAPDEMQRSVEFESPSPRYLVHLVAPGWDVIGFTSPWRPGVVSGHNDRVVWEPRPFEKDGQDLYADTQDIYVEKLNPSNPHQVEDEGRWVDTKVTVETIRVKGRAKPSTFEHEFTRSGPIVAVDPGRNLAFVVRWSGLEPGAAPELGALALDVARSAREFRSALTRWKAPARRIEYQEVNGPRAFQVAAQIPVRPSDTGPLPLPGWSRAYDWTGWKTLDDLPHGASQHMDTARSPAPSVERNLLDAVRGNSERSDALLRNLSAATSLRAQQAIVAAAIEESRAPAETEPKTIMFVHPLAVTPDARLRLDIGPLAAVGRLLIGSNWSLADWDRGSAMNAPGQSESPDSPHFADLARLAVTGTAPMPFSDRAVQAAAEATLILTPR